MRNYLAVIKLQLKNMFRRDRSSAKASRRWIIAAVALVILYGIVASSFIAMVAMMSSAFGAYSLQSEFVTLILLCGLMVVLVFGIVTVLTCLYFSRDTEFFLALPIKPSVVFAAKLTIVYFAELVACVLIMVPCLIAAGIALHASAIFYVLLPFAVLLTPAIPLFFAAIISVPVMYIVSFLRNRGALGSIVVLLLFGGFFVLYYMGISKMQNLNPEQVDLSAVQGMFRKIANTVYPLYALARAMNLTTVFGLGVAASVVVNLVIYFGSIIALGGIALVISATVYKKGAAGQLENAKRTKASGRDYRSTSTLKALMKKEWREIVRTPSFALNCLIGVVMCPIIVGFIGLTSNVSAIVSESGGAEALGEEKIRIIRTAMQFVQLWMIMFMSVGTNGAPATVLSREGEKFYYTKILPVDCKTQIKAKSYVYLIIGSVSSVLGAVVMAILDFDATFLICSIAFLLIYNFAAVHFGMWLDLRSPKLKWTTPNEVMKHNRNVLITVFGGMAVSLFLAVAGGVLHALIYTVLSLVWANVITWTMLLVAAFVLAAVFSYIVYNDCEKKIDRIEY